MIFISYIHFACLLFHLFAAVYTIRLNPRARLHQVGSLYFLCIALWNAGTVIINCPATPYWLALTAIKINGIGWIPFSCFILWFTAIFVKNKHKIFNTIILPLLFSIAAICIVLQWNGLIISGFIKVSWGWNIIYAHTIWTGVYFVLLCGNIVAALVMLAAFRRTTKIKYYNQQVRTVYFSAAGSLLIGFCTNAIMPMLSLYTFPNIADIGMTFLSLGIILNTLRYGTQIITPSLAAENIINTMSDALILVNREGKIARANKAAVSLIGAQVDNLSEIKFTSLFPNLTFVHGQEQSLPETILRVYNSDREISIRFSNSILRDEADEYLGMVCILHDITIQKRIERELARNEKLESLGVLAGGIAHDFNNLLVSIFGFMEMARTMAHDKNKVTGFLDKALDSCGTARSLTQQLLTFAKGGVPVKKVLFPGPAIKKAVEFPLSGSNVKSILNIADNLWAVEADENQISQVIHNIVLNARQAMPNGGAITIVGENFVNHNGTIPAISAGKYVKISCEDTGTGISADAIQKVFDPFYTTRNTGTGLGLTICHHIIRQHNGHIELQSILNKGTTVTLFLPATDKLPQPPTKRITVPQPSGSGKVLLMDDEARVVEIVSEMLRFLGYSVTTASNGEDAITAYKKAFGTSEAFNAIILDLTVKGGMGGKETCEKIKQIDPGVIALVSSGYSHDPVIAHPEDFGFKAVMHKPYSMQQLSSVLAEVLEDRSVST